MKTLQINRYAAINGANSNQITTRKLAIVALGLFTLFTIFVQMATLLRVQPEYHLQAFDQLAYDEGIEICSSFSVKANQTINAGRSNPRFVTGTKTTLIRNATLIDGDGEVYAGRNILLKDGVVVSTDLKTLGMLIDDDIVVWEAGGRFVSPGLVDMHSHAGVDSLPEFWGIDDGNEISSPITSQVRSIDGINPSDEMFRRILSGGVTSSLILPGSANLMGGEAFVVKNRAVKSLKVEDMLVQAGVTTKRQRWIKMACGENPKRVYPKLINSRLGEAWGFRHRFDQAKQLMKKQDRWCAKAAAGAQHVAGEEFPLDLELETVVGVLRGDVSIHNHCYETMDLEMQIRNSHEFGFSIAAFHHALDAYRVPDMIKENNITIATFANLWGYKKEAFQGSVHAGKILTDNGIPLAYKSDHPVTNSQNLIYQAQIGYNFGVPEKLAFASVTSVPAESLKLANRIGYLRKGYDADILLWNDHPLKLGAYPLQVWIDGVSQIEVDPKDLEANPVAVSEFPKSPLPAIEKDHQCIEEARSFVLKGIKQSFLHEDIKTLGDSQIAVIQDGKIVCYGSESDCSGPSTSNIAAGAKVISLVNGHIAPGITTTAPLLGLGEIESEPSTLDGKVDNSKPEEPDTVVAAYDGLVFGGPHMERAHAMGVLEVITAPKGPFLQGVSVAFKTSAKDILDPSAVVKKTVALHFAVGHSAKTDAVRSESAQIALLRRILHDNSPSESTNSTADASGKETEEAKDNIYAAAANGSLPLLITADSASTISHLLLLKRDFPRIYPILHGGTEAHLLAPALASAGIPVLLNKHRCMPETYRARHCLPGPPLSNSTNFGVLRRHGVQVALVGNDDGNLGEGYWEAGWAAGLVGGLSERETVGLVSWDVRRILRLPGGVTGGGFVVFEGSPLEWGSRVALTVDEGGIARCYPAIQ